MTDFYNLFMSGIVLLIAIAVLMIIGLMAFAISRTPSNSFRESKHNVRVKSKKSFVRVSEPEKALLRTIREIERKGAPEFISEVSELVYNKARIQSSKVAENLEDDEDF